MKKMSDLVINITPLNGETHGDESFKLEFSDGREKVIRSWDYTFIYSFPYLYRNIIGFRID
ncbi:MAG: hypothetical protein R3E32_23010 [Chitinophagales bacterium]